MGGRGEQEGGRGPHVELLSRSPLVLLVVPYPRLPSGVLWTSFWFPFSAILPCFVGLLTSVVF